MNNRQLEAGSAWIVAGLLIWLGLAVAIGAAGMLRNLRPQTIPSVVALLTAIVLVICWRVPAARTAAMSVDVRYILGFHLVRFFAGVLFLIEASDGRLAAAF